MNIPNSILTLPLTAFKPKTRPKDGQNCENQGSEITYIAPLSKMLKILLYQLFMANKKAFLQFLPMRPLNDTFGPPNFQSIFCLSHDICMIANIALVWQQWAVSFA